MQNTFIIPIIRTDLIERCLETLYKYTPPNFYVYVIDQSVDGIDATRLRNKYKNLMIIRTPKTFTHTTGNLGFAQATNLGITLVQTPLFTMCNDDVEFINRGWWDGVIETFDIVHKATPDRPAMMVNPASLKLADWSVGRRPGEDFFIIPEKKRYSQIDWDHLVNNEHYINEHLTIMPGSVIDGVTMYCSTFDTQKFLTVGMLNEKFYPGGAEDYDYNARANMRGFRCVGTTLSWVLHHWSRSFATIADKEKVKDLVDDNLRFGDQQKLWGSDKHEFDVWGMMCPQGDERMITDDGVTAYCPHHRDETYNIPPVEIAPL